MGDLLQLLNQLHICAGRRKRGGGLTSTPRKIHAQLIKQAWIHLDHLPNILVNAYSKSHLLHDAFHLFTQLGSRRDVVSWATILTSCNRSLSPHRSLSIFPQMFHLDGLLPDPFVLSALVKACSILGALRQGKQLHAHSILSPSLSSDDVLKSSLVDMYANCASPDHAFSVFTSILRKTTVSITALIHAYAMGGQTKNAVHVFERMTVKNPHSFAALLSGLVQCEKHGEAMDIFNCTMRENNHGVPLVDPHVLSSIITASSGLVSLVLGQQLHCIALGLGFIPSIFVSNSLVDMYGKCSDISAARRVFECIVYRDVVSWTSVIVGLSRHGLAEEAISMYKGMLSRGLEPNQVTFVGLIYACSHAGLVEEGRKFFNSMVSEYGIQPSLCHYTCYIDLLCRYGYLEEAETVLRSMPFEPDDAAWASFLSACRCHGNTEVAARVEELLAGSKDRVNGGSSYVLLSNIYADASLWDKVSQTRILMMGMRFPKKHGCSFIGTREQSV